MKPVEFHDQTKVFGPPPGMTAEECGTLPVKVGKYLEKYPQFESVWELTDEEIIELQKSKRVRVRIVSSGQPPLSLVVEPTEPEKETEVKEPKLN